MPIVAADRTPNPRRAGVEWTTTPMSLGGHALREFTTAS